MAPPEQAENALHDQSFLTEIPRRTAKAGEGRVEMDDDGI
jgi:hypothetical protein